MIWRGRTFSPLDRGCLAASHSIFWMTADPEVAHAIARSFLGKLPSELIEALTADEELIDYPPGTVFYREGSAPRVMLVVTGLIRIYMTSPKGRQVTVRYARDSDVLGIAHRGRAPERQRPALAPSSLLSIDHRELIAAAPKNARVAFALAEELNRRLDDTLQQTAHNAFGSVNCE